MSTSMFKLPNLYVLSVQDTGGHYVRTPGRMTILRDSIALAREPSSGLLELSRFIHKVCLKLELRTRKSAGVSLVISDYARRTPISTLNKLNN